MRSRDELLKELLDASAMQNAYLDGLGQILAPLLEAITDVRDILAKAKPEK